MPQDVDLSNSCCKRCHGYLFTTTPARIAQAFYLDCMQCGAEYIWESKLGKIIEYKEDEWPLFSQNHETEKIVRMVTSFGEMLKEKNLRYGNSAIEPLNIFYREGEHSGIESRIDDKLARIKVAVQQGISIRKNDVADIIGYLFLFCLRNGWTDFSDLID